MKPDSIDPGASQSMQPMQPPPMPSQLSELRPTAYLPLALLAAAIVLVVYGALEVVRPNHFLWDDNATAFLPMYTHNGRALFGDGELAHVNHHQYLTQLHLGNAQSGVLYPPVYLALLVAEHVLGDGRHVIDVLAVGHLAAAAAFMALLARSLGVRASLSLLGGVLWATMPFLPLVGRNWIFMTYLAALLPVNFFCLERLRQQPGVGRAFWLAVVKALLFFSGYPQMAVVAAIFDVVYLALRSAIARWIHAEPFMHLFRQIGWYSIAVAMTSALAAPLILPMLEVRGLSAYRADALSRVEFLSKRARVARLRCRAVPDDA